MLQPGNSLCLFTLSLLLGACAAGDPAAPAQPAPAPEPTLPALPFADVPLGDHLFTRQEAKALVEEIQADWPPAADDPLRRPSSLAEVETILKLDQFNLFGAALAIAERTEGLQARVLEAQIQLAWAESYTILMEVVASLGRHLDRTIMQLQQRMNRSQKQEARLQRMVELTARISRVAELFQVMSMEHTGKGLQLANEVILNHPKSYLGYRLAADHDRTVGQWDEFDRMIAKIEKHNPDSNGLIFLRGAAALQRDVDRDAAAGFYRQALANDPKFVRAQAHLVMCQSDFEDLYAEFQKLKKLNSHHQLVQWLDDATEIVRTEAR